MRPFPNLPRASWFQTILARLFWRKVIAVDYAREEGRAVECTIHYDRTGKMIVTNIREISTPTPEP